MELPFLFVQVGLATVVEAGVVVSSVLDLAMFPTQPLVLHHQLRQLWELVCERKERGKEEDLFLHTYTIGEIH